MNNWTKEDMRGAVNAWLEAEAQNSNTIVYYGGDSGFLYYLRNNNHYSNDMEKNVHLMPWYRDKTVEEYTDYINTIYGSTDWPSEIYFIASHNSPRDDISSVLKALTENNYSSEELFNHSDGILIRLSRM